MIYTNGQRIISDKSKTELFDFAKRVGIKSLYYWGDHDSHFKIPNYVSAEILRKAGATFVYGEKFDAIKINPPRHRLFIPYVRQQGGFYYRKCHCGKEGAVGIFKRKEQGALAYITDDKWECATCQKITDEVQRAQIA